MNDTDQIIWQIMPFITVLFLVAFLRAIFNLFKRIALGNCKTDTIDNTINVKVEHRIDIDKDLQKYFNYKE